MDRVTDEQLNYRSDGLYYRDGQPFSGVVEIRSPDGTLEAEEKLKDGLLSGRKRSWHPSGVLELEAECAWDVRHGRVRTWYEDGHLEADELYEFGVRTRGTRWDEQGQVTEQFKLSESDPAFRIVEAARAAFQAHEQTDTGNAS